jgi:hypothetical protein
MHAFASLNFSSFLIKDVAIKRTAFDGWNIATTMQFNPPTDCGRYDKNYSKNANNNEYLNHIFS